VTVVYVSAASVHFQGLAPVARQKQGGRRGRKAPAIHPDARGVYRREYASHPIRRTPMHDVPVDDLRSIAGKNGAIVVSRAELERLIEGGGEN